jgi:hypothetical protein
MRRAIRIIHREMKRLILAGCLAVCGAFSSGQAAQSDFFIDDNGVANAVDETSASASSGRSTDSVNRNSGILTGRTLVRLDARYGDISVETIFGKVNGAQLRVSW